MIWPIMRSDCPTAYASALSKKKINAVVVGNLHTLGGLIGVDLVPKRDPGFVERAGVFKPDRPRCRYSVAERMLGEKGESGAGT
jgi:hypothetical protein